MNNGNNRVLILSPFFYPEMISTGKYNTYLAEELVAQGLPVTVVSSYPIYPSWNPEKSDPTLPGMDIRRGGSWLRYPKSTLLRRAILECWYSWHAVTTYFGLKSKPTHLVAVFPPSLFFLLLALVLPSSTKKIGIVHDLQGVYASQSKGLIGRVVNAAIHMVEQKCFAGCDRLIFLSESMAARAIQEYGLDKEQCAVCYPFVALPDHPLSEGTALKHLFDEQKINVVYSGALGDKQNPDALVDFFSNLTVARSGVCCHIFSAGPHFERLRSSTSELGTVHFHDLVDSEHLSELYARSGVQVIPQAFGTGDGSLPSKLPNLMAVGVPVFVICDSGSELADLVKEADAGGVCNSWDSADLVDHFVQFLPQMIDEPRSERRLRQQEFVQEKFSIRRVVDEIIKV